MQSWSYCGALNLSYKLPSLAHQVLIFTWVKWSIWGLSALPKDTTSNNFPILRGEKHDISLKILHQAGFETARQAATLTKLRALTISPCPSTCSIRYGHQRGVSAIENCTSSKYETFTQCWFNVEPPSTTLAQHWTSIVWTPGVSRPMINEEQAMLLFFQLLFSGVYHHAQLPGNTHTPLADWITWRGSRQKTKRLAGTITWCGSRQKAKRLAAMM